MKTIITHFSPDVDAICSIWLVEKFLPGFSKAKIEFVPAGETFEDRKPDENNDLIHVDTGFGRFDHHQDNRDTCAAKLVYEYLVDKGYLKKKEIEVLKRLVFEVNEIDHFRNVFWKDASSDRFEFCLDSIIDGLKLMNHTNDLKVVETSFALFDAVYTQLSNKVWAEKIIEEEALKFSTAWGKAIGFETANDEVVHLAQKIGYRLVVRKDPKKGYVRIKSLPDPKIDLTLVYNSLKDIDRQASWFLHASRHMILNGSTKNPKMRPTKLSLKEIINIIKK